MAESWQRLALKRDEHQFVFYFIFFVVFLLFLFSGNFSLIVELTGKHLRIYRCSCCSSSFMCLSFSLSLSSLSSLLPHPLRGANYESTTNEITMKTGTGKRFAFALHSFFVCVAVCYDLSTFFETIFCTLTLTHIYTVTKPYSTPTHTCIHTH